MPVRLEVALAEPREVTRSEIAGRGGQNFGRGRLGRGRDRVADDLRGTHRRESEQGDGCNEAEGAHVGYYPAGFRMANGGTCLNDGTVACQSR